MPEANLKVIPNPIRGRIEKAIKTAPKTDYSASSLGSEELSLETFNIDTNVNRWLQKQFAEASLKFSNSKLQHYDGITSIDACMALMPNVVAIMTDTVALWNGVNYMARSVEIRDLLHLREYFKDKKILLYRVKLNTSIDKNNYQPGYCYRISYAEL